MQNCDEYSTVAIDFADEFFNPIYNFFFMFHTRVYSLSARNWIIFYFLDFSLLFFPQEILATKFLPQVSHSGNFFFPLYFLFSHTRYVVHVFSQWTFDSDWTREVCATGRCERETFDWREENPCSKTRETRMFEKKVWTWLSRESECYPTAQHTRHEEIHDGFLTSLRSTINVIFVSWPKSKVVVFFLVASWLSAWLGGEETTTTATMRNLSDAFQQLVWFFHFPFHLLSLPSRHIRRHERERWEISDMAAWSEVEKSPSVVACHSLACTHFPSPSQPLHPQHSAQSSLNWNGK